MDTYASHPWCSCWICGGMQVYMIAEGLQLSTNISLGSIQLPNQFDSCMWPLNKVGLVGLRYWSTRQFQLRQKWWSLRCYFVNTFCMSDVQTATNGRMMHYVSRSMVGWNSVQQQTNQAVLPSKYNLTLLLHVCYLRTIKNRKIVCYICP